MIVLVATDATSEAFLADAVADRRRRDGALPSGLRVVTDGHRWTSLAPADERADDAGVALLMTQVRAAAFLGVSVKTLQRLKESGRLSPVQVHGRPMFRRADLEVFVAELEAEASHGRQKASCLAR